MPFTDRVQINVEGGHGGNGCMSFRREPKIPKGGPDGGNGGRGGGVVLVADEQVTDLSRFRHAVHHRGANGGHGEGKVRHGRNGDDLLVEVPPGTRVLRDGHVIAELAAPGDRVPVARGGDGGVGNRAFRSSTRQAPRNTTPGTSGEEAWLTLELRLPVDVGIVGLPNAGKSALLVALTGASATVAPYPQSTREPAFGPLEDEDGNLYLVADLPGVAADGVPRRDAHLGQLERARVVLHAVDAADPAPAGERIALVRDAVAPFVGDGAEEIVVATHSDEAEPVDGADVAVDAVTGRGVDALRARVIAALRAG
ncbi:MAG TPA: 50S ribosome-binding GTPase [Miltoncostaeaceae bacterium]|nr:50S ribosome-binding GTPase [Miltoncostaeaceae bacterium]